MPDHRLPCWPEPCLKLVQRCLHCGTQTGWTPGREEGIPERLCTRQPRGPAGQASTGEQVEPAPLQPASTQAQCPAKANRLSKVLQGDHSPTRPPPNILVPSQDCAGPRTAGLRRTVTSLRALPAGPAEGEPQGERPCAGEGAKTRLVALASASLLQTGLDWGFSPGTWPPVLLRKTFLNMNLLICVWNKRDIFWTVFCCFVITGVGPLLG